jgi:hypothetical protein
MRSWIQIENWRALSQMLDYVGELPGGRPLLYGSHFRIGPVPARAHISIVFRAENPIKI